MEIYSEHSVERDVFFFLATTGVQLVSIGSSLTIGHPMSFKCHNKLLLPPSHSCFNSHFSPINFVTVVPSVTAVPSSVTAVPSWDQSLLPHQLLPIISHYCPISQCCLMSHCRLISHYCPISHCCLTSHYRFT